MIDSRLFTDMFTILDAQKLWQESPDAEGTFKLINDSDLNLANAFRYQVNDTESVVKGVELSNLIEKHSELSFSQGAIEFLVVRGVDPAFAEYLKSQTLPEVSVESTTVNRLDSDTEIRLELDITCHGRLCDAIFWGPFIRGAIVEKLSHYQIGEFTQETYLEGVTSFQNKAEFLKRTNAKFILGGTSTRLDTDWFGAVYILAVGFFGDRIVGTTNVAAAFDFGIEPIAPNYTVDRKFDHVAEHVVVGKGNNLVVVGNPNSTDIYHTDSHFPGLTYLWDTDLVNDMVEVPDLRWEHIK